MRVLHIAGLAIIFAVVRSTTSTASGQRWANKPYETPGGYTRPPTMRPNVHAPRLHKREAPILVGPILPHRARPENFHGFLIGPSPPFPLHSQPESTETMTDDHPEHHHQPRPVKTQKPVKQEATIHQPPHTGVTSMMPGQHSLPDSTETMTDDHSEHHHQPRPVMTQKPRPISETPLMSSEAASEEPPMTPVMTEDIAIMQSEELPNAIESNKVMTEEMSEHDQMIPVHDQMISVHEFKEVLHEIVQDAVDKILTKKAGIVGKLITAKQNLLGHDASRGPQLSFAHCVCDEDLFDRRGRGDCNSRSRDFNGRKWCYLETFSLCTDDMPSRQFPGRLWSHAACS